VKILEEYGKLIIDFQPISDHRIVSLTFDGTLSVYKYFPSLVHPKPGELVLEDG